MCKLASKQLHNKKNMLVSRQQCHLSRKEIPLMAKLLPRYLAYCTDYCVTPQRQTGSTSTPNLVQMLKWMLHRHQENMESFISLMMRHSGECRAGSHEGPKSLRTKSSKWPEVHGVYGLDMASGSSCLHHICMVWASCSYLHCVSLLLAPKEGAPRLSYLLAFPDVQQRDRGKWWSLKGVSSQASNMDPNSITYAYLIIIKSGDKIKHSYETIAKFILMKDILWIKHKEGQRKVGDIWWNVESNKRGMVVMVKAMMTASSFPVH